MLVHQVPPSSKEAEEGLIGCLLIGSSYIEEAASTITPEMFYYPEHETIMRGIIEVHHGGLPVDIITVTNALRKKGEKSSIASTLMELSSSIVSDANAATYAQIIIQKHINRQAIKMAMEVQEAAYEDDVDEVISKSSSMADSLLNNIPSVNAESLSAVIGANLKEIDERQAHKNEIIYIDTGIGAMDRVLGGFDPGSLVVIAGRPGQGKTAMSLQLAYNIGLQYPILFFTLEMTRTEIGNRYLTMLTDIDSIRLKRGTNITADEWRLIEKATADIEGRKIIIDDTSRLTIYNLRSKVYRMVRSRGVKVVVIDYLQLMEGAKGKEGAEYYGTISRTCKQLAKELKIVVILLSQLNREVEKRGEKIPRLHDLRACLSVESSLIYTKNNVRTNAASQINLLSLSGDKLCDMTSENIPKSENDVYRVRTASGRFVDATIDHNILTTEGYKPVRALTNDDVLIVAKNFETPGVYYPESRFIGLMLGNGSMAGKSVPSLIVNDKEVSDWFVNFIHDKFGFYPKWHKHRSNRVFQWDMTKHNIRTKEGNPVKNWLIEKELWGNYAYTKRIPNWFMETADSQSIYELMAGLIETDGSIYECASGSMNISYSTVSLDLANQIMYLLAKIGIIAYIDNGYKSKKATCKLYKITITNAENIKLFKEKIPIIGYKANKLNSLNLNRKPSLLSDKVSHETSVNISRLIKRGRLQVHGNRAATRAKLRELARDNDLGKYKWLLSDNIHLDKISSIEYAGKTNIFDRSVPGTNNFIVNGIVVHNSGEIEQDADIVIFPVRCDKAGINDPGNGLGPGKAIISIAKNRNGRVENVVINVSENAAKWWDENDIFAGPQTAASPHYLDSIGNEFF